MQMNLKMSGTFLMSLVVWMANIFAYFVLLALVQCSSTTKSTFLLYFKGYWMQTISSLLLTWRGFGIQSDGGILLASDLFSFNDGKGISFPEPDFLPNSNVTAPYVMLEDEAYPFLPYLMKPHEPNSLTDRKHNFNECLSRARKPVECAFRILYSK